MTINNFIKEFKKLKKRGLLKLTEMVRQELVIHWNKNLV